MNKAQLIDALAQRLGDKRTAGAAVDGLVDVIVRTVHKGEKVNITGFGVFEKRARAARMARNPRTGETVRVRKTNVPAFRAGTTFKDVISGTKKLPRVAATTAAKTVTNTASAAGTATRATRAAASKAAPSSASARTTSTRTAAAKTTAKPAATKTTATKTGAAKTSTAKGSANTSKPAATKATATKTTAKATKAAPKPTTKTSTAKATATKATTSAKKPTAKKK